MLLSIIIPQYSETEARIAPLLHSINLQRGIDFRQVEVIIVNNHSDTEPSPAFLRQFAHLNIRYLRTPENRGPGLCRQYGLNYAHGDFVTFCDADDLYHSIGTLSYYFSVITAKDAPEILRTGWLEELKTPQGLTYITHTHENTWLHGKVYSRKFLAYNGIRFSEELLYHEDSYFNAIAAALTDRQMESEAITYMWTWDDNTITRRNNSAYTYNSMAEFTHAIRLACRWLKDIRPEVLPEKVVQVLAYVFTCINDGMANGWTQEAITATTEECKALYNEFEAEFKALQPWQVATLELQERNKIAAVKPYIPMMTFMGFVQGLQKNTLQS